jgi:hypothetical protein
MFLLQNLPLFWQQSFPLPQSKEICRKKTCNLFGFLVKVPFATFKKLIAIYGELWQSWTALFFIKGLKLKGWVSLKKSSEARPQIDCKRALWPMNFFYFWELHRPHRHCIICVLVSSLFILIFLFSIVFETVKKARAFFLAQTKTGLNLTLIF